MVKGSNYFTHLDPVDHIAQASGPIWVTYGAPSTERDRKHAPPQVRTKHHNMETHIPIFARKWNNVGRFGEDIVETVHREVNVVESSITNLKNQYLRKMKYIDDRFNLYFEQACQAKPDKHKLEKHQECHKFMIHCARHTALKSGTFDMIRLHNWL